MARLALILAIATAVCIALVDAPLARWLATRDTHPHAWEQLIAVLEYAIGIEPWKWLGVSVLVAGSLASLYWRRGTVAWWSVTTTHLLARNLMIWGKAVTGRLRPTEWHGGAMWFQHGASFPSGHVVLFASLALPLAAVYPRLRVLIAIPIVAAIARVMASAHFASDVLGGFALSAAVTAVCVAVVRRSQRPGAAR